MKSLRFMDRRKGVNFMKKRNVELVMIEINPVFIAALEVDIK